MLISAAALAEAAGKPSLNIAALSAAPETPAQTIVRLLAGVALIVALPWWLGAQGEESAATYAGSLLQRAALAAFWSVLVLPAPGDTVWAIIVQVGGTLLACTGMRALSERWLPASREQDAARLVWATALPVALVALLVVVWSGA